MSSKKIFLAVITYKKETIQLPLLLCKIFILVCAHVELVFDKGKKVLRGN